MKFFGSLGIGWLVDGGGRRFINFIAINEIPQLLLWNEKQFSNVEKLLLLWSKIPIDDCKLYSVHTFLWFPSSIPNSHHSHVWNAFLFYSNYNIV